MAYRNIHNLIEDFKVFLQYRDMDLLNNLNPVDMDKCLILYDQETEFIDILNKSFNKYFECGARSSKKVTIIHNYLVKKLSCLLNPMIYSIDTEINVPTSNSSGRKKCDVVVYNKISKKFELVISVKFVCSNFKQNKNNYIETLIGECVMLKSKNPNLKIITLNIIPKQMPYYYKNGNIKKIENITLKDIEAYNININNGYDESITYLVEADYKTKTIKNIHKDTPFKCLKTTLKKLELL